jgi:hypothetical protein
MPALPALLCVLARLRGYLGDHGIEGNGHMMMLEKAMPSPARSCPGSRMADSRGVPHTRMLAAADVIE